MKAFPIPVVALGPGTQTEEESLDYLPMPKEMDTYRAPMLPEPGEIAGRAVARDVLGQVLTLLDQVAGGGVGGQIGLLNLPTEDRRLIDQVMGEGEASAIVREEASPLEVHIQESVFAGVWRLMTFNAGALIDDVIEAGPVPALLRLVAKEDAESGYRPWLGPLPSNVQNAPLLVDEVRDQVARWQPGQTSHVINLTLLPVTPEDIGFLDHQLGTGRVLLLSRGYGNCRISNTRLPHCWRVVYYNSMDKAILNTVEVVDMPEVAMAAPEDLRDSHERLQDILTYLEST
ncbi:hydrogenase expression/formation protein [Curvibacter delicatus]|jgi:hydrogenase-1 operon protein HyaF|uniref:hydrogenase expression/formation protein n=1 Tax=Curvibacter delicatus TaxID=80879 RepID=UPI00082FB89F|nr:hydrogenase expression/formation protein [Curvibacter delicatus]